MCNDRNPDGTALAVTPQRAVPVMQQGVVLIVEEVL